MTIEDAADLVGDGLLHVAALDEHGVERGDRALGGGAAPLEQARQRREHAGRIAAPRRRLARGQAHLSSRAGKAGHRVHQEEHALSLIAEVLGDRRGHVGALQSDQRGHVAGGADHHAALSSLFAQRVLEELHHLATALADEADHEHVGARLPGDLSEQRALAHAAAREEADALAFAHREESVDGAHPEGQGLLDAGAGEGVGRRAHHRERHEPRQRLERRSAVDGLAEAIEHPAEERIANRDGEPCPERPHLVIRAYALGRAQGHQHRAIEMKAHHLGPQDGIALADDLHELAHPHPGDRGAHREAHHFLHAARDPNRIEGRELRLETREVERHAQSLSYRPAIFCRAISCTLPPCRRTACRAASAAPGTRRSTRR